ncbi:unnamed protein product [Phaeothamnion confervicola]
MVALCGVVAAYCVVAHNMHHHDHEEVPEYSWQHIRNKPYPWHCSDCSALDRE